MKGGKETQEERRIWKQEKTKKLKHPPKAKNAENMKMYLNMGTNLKLKSHTTNLQFKGGHILCHATITILSKQQLFHGHLLA